MDPEQIYQEVLQEEQAKGSVTAVAEGRAKAARQRANHGSPHPKEARWWPGSQPRWEGGEASPAAEPQDEEVAEEPVEETPAEQPAAEAPAPAAEQPAAEAPAPAEPAPAAPATEAAPQPLAAAAAAAPTGVTHGTPSGNRLRPEDGVATQAQFDAQQAHYERRKLIDELVNSGVPAVAAQGSGRPAAPFLAILYILIPILAIFVLLANDDGGGEAGGGEGEPAAEAPAEGGALTVSAANISFDTDLITVPADEEAVIDFINEDSVEHNISVYPDQQAGVGKANAFFTGDIIQGGQEITYDVPAQNAGEYFFQCDVHPNMNGAYVAE